MNLLIYTFTVIFSITLKIINQLYYLKQLANEGYKYENFKLRSSKIIILFIPVVNIVYAIKKTNSNKNIKNISKIELFEKNNIIPLTKIEQEIYQNNPNLLNALNLNFSNQATPNMVILYIKDGTENIIYINQENELNIILSTQGPIANLSKKEQYKQLEEQLKEINFTNEKQNKIIDNNIIKNNFEIIHNSQIYNY